MYYIGDDVWKKTFPAKEDDIAQLIIDSRSGFSICLKTIGLEKQSRNIARSEQSSHTPGGSHQRL